MGALETILVVDDEDYVRELVSTILRVEGYNVLEAPGGEEALRESEGHPGPIHLLLTDVVMAPMGGPELARRFAGARPEARILFVSGYPDDDSLRGAIATSAVAFLPKPFTPKSLLRKIRDILDAVPREVPAEG